jgi:hypothetical protein
MSPIEVGLSQSTSTPTSTGSGGVQISGDTYSSNPMIWIIGGVIALVGLVLYLKLR